MSGAEVICGIGALRRNKLQRQLNTAPAAQPSPTKSSLRSSARPPAWDDESGTGEVLSAAPTADASM
eukprot:scaffold119191_cov18-Phaeocystis_antarctica.AAC.1